MEEFSKETKHSRRTRGNGVCTWIGTSEQKMIQ